MIENYILSIIFLFIVFIVTQSYGSLFAKIFFGQYNINSAETGFIGFFSLLIISLSIHFFLPLSIIVNTIIIIFGILIFFYFNRYLFIDYVKNFVPLILVLSLLTISVEYHSDYFWYHLPYINILNQYKIIFGSSNINDFFGYGHGWLDIMALFTLPKFNNIFTTFISIIFVVYFIYYLIDKFYNSDSEILKIFSLLSLIFFFLQYPLIKDYGAEIQINLIYILLFFNIYIFYNNLENKDKIFTMIIFLIIFSFFLRLNSIIFLPLIILFFIFNIKYLFNYISNNRIIICFYLFAILILVLKNVIITGCLAYPIYFTCIDGFSWGIGVDHAYERYLMLSAQSKGYLLYLVYELGYNSIYEFYKFAKQTNFVSPFEYLHDNFNWIIYWIKYEHDKSRLLNITIFLFIVLFLSKLIYYKKINLLKSYKFLLKEKFLISIYFFPIISYFYLLPQGRYGGFSIIYVFFALIVSLILKNSKNIVIYTLLVISILYFVYKNVSNVNFNSVYKTYPDEKSEYILNKTIKNKLEFSIKLQITDGKPNYCNDIKGICLSEMRYECIEEININNGYIFINPNQKKCAKIVQNYFFF